ncbi:hypothetical protein CDL15_Pgr005150 [Punica granatum]|uniref:Uncharacterized protein n=1 Tax=Punica granatum TaxID=22663 RepID=A0A218WQD7_PUNGR|nr:hypothetical protein CDL15_Pgr005150 [Punica granatum]
MLTISLLSSSGTAKNSTRIREGLTSSSQRFKAWHIVKCIEHSPRSKLEYVPDQLGGGFQNKEFLSPSKWLTARCLQLVNKASYSGQRCSRSLPFFFSKADLFFTSAVLMQCTRR